MQAYRNLTKRRRWLLLKNPWNLSDDQKERLSTLVHWNTPIVRGYYLKEAFQLFWDYKQPNRATDHLEKWMRSAMRSRLEPFKKFVRMLRGHLNGILAWTSHRVSHGAVEGMNNKIKSIAIAPSDFARRRTSSRPSITSPLRPAAATRRTLITLLR